MFRLKDLLLLSLATTCCFHLAHPQAVIRERADILPLAKRDSRIKYTELHNYWVAPRRGVLKVTPVWVYTPFLSLPASEHVLFQTRDTSYVFPALPWLPCYRDSGVSQWNNRCTEQSVQVPWFSADNSCLYEGNHTAPDSFFLWTKPVSAGDTLRLSYFGNYVDTVGGVSFYWDSLGAITDWVVELGYDDKTIDPSCWDNNITPYYERLYASVSYTPDTVVKFTPVARDTVYPTYAGHNGTADKKNYIDLELSTTYGKMPAPNVWVRIVRPVVVDSGGHSHAGARPLGKFRLPQGSKWGSMMDTVRQKTDSEGKLQFRFVSSQFGGIERISVRLASDSTHFDTMRIVTCVPGLSRLSNGTHYAKVGGSCNHHGPRLDNSVPPGCLTPDNDHYGKAQLIRNLTTLADSFAIRYPSITLRINDMSLPNGGKFDIDGGWETPADHHSEHREGTNADLPVSYLGSSGKVDSVKEGVLRFLIGVVIGDGFKDERYADSLRTKRSDTPHFHVRQN